MQIYFAIKYSTEEKFQARNSRFKAQLTDTDSLFHPHIAETPQVHPPFLSIKSFKLKMGIENIAFTRYFWQPYIRGEMKFGNASSPSSFVQSTFLSFNILQFYKFYYKVVPPPSDMRDAAAAAAVGTTPVEAPGFDKCSSLQNKTPPAWMSCI